MFSSKHYIWTFLIAILAWGFQILSAQSLPLPPSGGNQKAEVSQYMGMVKATFTYNSPDVTDSRGNSREGKIWGQLVPYGLSPNNFGTAKEMPWRAGANENTLFSVSHDVMIQGQKLPAGTYGFHIIPGEPNQDWTLIFSQNTSSWGSYFYDQAEDVLRVTTRPDKASFHEWLTFGFTDRQLTQCEAALYWENLKIPFTISVPDMNDLYVAEIEESLRSSSGFNWQNWVSAANFCVNNQTHLEKGMEWAEAAVSRPFVGQANYTTLSTKANVLMAMNRMEDAHKVMDEAMEQPTAGVLQIHQYARQCLARGEKERALEVFQKNEELHPDTWPVHVGLARGYSAVGNFKKALKHAKIAQGNVPEGDQLNAQSVENMIAKLSEGEDVN
ncbi:MAG: DUF2911 domain-containing protein [Bacteroidota bacterium]